MKKYIFVVTFLCSIILPAISWSADKIEGNACFTYGDNESLVQAERTAKMLALRNAIESYGVFIESKSQIKNYEIMSDIIESVSAEQVRNVKILKRTQSGRKICYTIRGYVEPERMKKAMKNYSSDVSTSVQLQDNGYVRIIGEPMVVRICTRMSSDNKVEKKYLPEFDDERLNVLEREKYGFNRDCSRFLSGDLQFLKHCIANTISSGDAIKDMSEMFAGNLDYSVPQFRCNYRFKVFVTLSSEEGNEIETKGDYPVAYASGSSDRRKIEMFPGEKTIWSFPIPYNAKSWKVWVPK
jgi:hypothetical protein